MNKLYVATGLVIAAVVGGAASAFAVPFDATTAATTMAGTAVDAMGPAIIAIAGAFVVLAVASWAVRAVFRAIGSGGRHV